MKALMKILKGIAVAFFGLVFLLIGSCKVIEYTGSKPIRDVCAKYSAGANFSAVEFGKDLESRKIRIGSVVAGQVRVSFFEVGSASKLPELDRQPVSGSASATVAVGFPKFTCTIAIANGRVTSSSVSEWD